MGGGAVPLFVDVSRSIPVVHSDGSYSERLEYLRHRRVSGVYVILSLALDLRPLYVGESHSGRLFETITRHFRAWRPARKSAYANGRRSGGVTYNRASVRVAWVECAPELCGACQWAEIVRLSPRDNERADLPGEIKAAADEADIDLLGGYLP